MSAAFPTGHVMSDVEWEAVAELCRERDCMLLYWSSFEGIVFDGRPVRSPVAHEGMRERTVIVGSVSIEQRMIGWRVGWVIAPGEMADEAARAHIYNGLLASGFGQIGAAAALREPESDLARCVEEWQRRRDAMLEQLRGLPVARSAGAWAMRPWVLEHSVRLARAWNIAQPLWLGFGLAHLLNAFVQRRYTRVAVFGLGLVVAWILLFSRGL